MGKYFLENFGSLHDGLKCIDLPRSHLTYFIVNSALRTQGKVTQTVVGPVRIRQVHLSCSEICMPQCGVWMYYSVLNVFQVIHENLGLVLKRIRSYAEVLTRVDNGGGAGSYLNETNGNLVSVKPQVVPFESFKYTTCLRLAVTIIEEKLSYVFVSNSGASIFKRIYYS